MTNAIDRHIDTNKIDKWMKNKLERSVSFWEKQTRNAEEIVLDFNNFDNEIEKYDRHFSKLAM